MAGTKKAKVVVVVEVLGGLVNGATAIAGEADIEVFDWDSIQDPDNMGPDGYTESALWRAENLPASPERDRLVSQINEEIEKHQAAEADEERRSREHQAREIADARRVLIEAGELSS